jgi:rare lipoprotein A
MGWRSLNIEIGPAVRIGAIVALSLGLAQCGKVSSNYGVAPSARVVAPGEPVPKGQGVYRVGKPYVIAGKTYTPEDNPNYTATGLASWYGDDFHGRQTANGEVFDMNAISAAHPTLPMPSYVRITNLTNRRSLIVRVNDRGPYHPGRVIDVSVRAAKLLGFLETGTTHVRVDYVGRAALEGSDDAKLAATLRHDDTPAAAPVMVASRNPTFLGQFFDPKPLTRNSPAARASPDVAPPTPRPVQPTTAIATRTPTSPTYSLASSRAVPAPAPAPTFAARTVVANQPTSFESRFGPALPQAPVRAEPLSAYAPSGPAGVITGRGLY